MAGRKPGELTEKVITAPKYFEELLPLFQWLHEIGCEGDTAGNRDLRFDEYCCLMFFSVVLCRSSCLCPFVVQSFNSTRMSEGPNGFDANGQ